jgi:hypothetical protein
MYLPQPCKAGLQIFSRILLKQQDFFPPLGEIQRGYFEQQDRANIILFGTNTPPPLRGTSPEGEEILAHLEFNPALGGPGQKTK